MGETPFGWHVLRGSGDGGRGLGNVDHDVDDQYVWEKLEEGWKQKET